MRLMARTAGRPLPSGRLSHGQGCLLDHRHPRRRGGAVARGRAPGGHPGLIASGFYNGVHAWLKPNSPFRRGARGDPGAIPPVIGWWRAVASSRRRAR